MQSANSEAPERFSEFGEYKLNIGCGDNKIKSYVNIDASPFVNPDLVLDIKNGLPYPDDSVEEIVFFHGIEHIEEKFHPQILSEFWRVLKFDGELYVSYPEFIKVAKNYITNHQGKKEFWKKTIYGLQRYLGDYHVSLMDTADFCELLFSVGFVKIEHTNEAGEEYNTIVHCRKGNKPKSYEDLIVESCFRKKES